MERATQAISRFENTETAIRHVAAPKSCDRVNRSSVELQLPVHATSALLVSGVLADRKPLFTSGLEGCELPRLHTLTHPIDTPATAATAAHRQLARLSLHVRIDTSPPSLSSRPHTTVALSHRRPGACLRSLSHGLILFQRRRRALSRREENWRGLIRCHLRGDEPPQQPAGRHQIRKCA